MEPLYSPQSRAERLIAGGRVVLAAASLFAVWFDPSEPAKHAPVAYSLLVLYVVYSVVLAVLVWRSDAPPHRQGVITHCFDFVFFSLFIYFTAGPASPFTVYFVFSLICATLRWQWRGTLWTAVACIATFCSLGIYFSQVVGDPLFQSYSLIIRGVYLAVVAVLLGYLGAHEAQTRRDMERIAAWPQAEPRRIEPLARLLLEHAAQTVGAPRALLAWVEREEPWLYIAEWSAGEFKWGRSAPGEHGQLAAEALAGSSFLCPDTGDPDCGVLRKSAAGLERWRGAPIPPALLERLGLSSVLSAPVAGESLEGRVFFTGKASMTSDDLVLAEIVAGVLTARLDHFYLNQRVQEGAAVEERIRLARDLHDGVLQSLTGIGLRLAAVRGLLDENPQAARASLETLQELIAREQRDLRFFIQELKPPPLAPAGEASTLAGSVSELVRRIELEWGLRAELRMQGLEGPIPESLARDIYHVIRESLVNAVRHGEASAVRVRIARDETGALSITVADNGQGFPFQGRYSQTELAERKWGPRTLLERVTSLQGTLTVDSSSSGARLDIAIPWPEAL
ncbi:MAG TPA: sensor histidine kinase [Thermoanaerobaculia bacterium]